MQHTNFKGRVFMTHPTKAIYRWLLSDFVKVSTAPEATQGLYTDEDLSQSFSRIETIDYHSTMEVNGIKFTAYHAGHVLGAAMYFIEIAGVKVMFTGDYSREEDRHLNQAEVPTQRPDILITESTYGTGIHQPRPEKENRLTSLIHSTINKGGRCLLPVFALGRAQEILLILDEYWENHPELEGVKIYYASSLARKCMAVFQTYINMMNESIRKKFRDSRTNPFHFKHIKSIKSLDRFDDLGPCVMVASPGMLQNGVSRDLLERWAPDPKNALILTGYSVEGTMAKQILNEPNEIPSFRAPETKIPRRLTVEELSFAAHVDFRENSEFIDLVGAPKIILVHGEQNNMGRLRSALMSKYQDRKGTEHEVKIYNPKNCVELDLPFRSVKYARVVVATEPEVAAGDETETEKPSAVAAPLHEGQIVSGVLVEKDFEISLVGPADLREHTNLTTSVVRERQTVVVDAGSELVRYHLEQMFGAVEVLADDADATEFRVMGAVNVTHEGNQSMIEWEGNAMNDAIADSVLAILLAVDSSPASVKLSSKSCSHDHHTPDDNNAPTTTSGLHGKSKRKITVDERIDGVLAILRAQFGSALKYDSSDGMAPAKATIEIDNLVAEIDFDNLSVICERSKILQQRVSHVLERAVDTVAPLAQSLVAAGAGANGFNGSKPTTTTTTTSSNGAAVASPVIEAN
ncbi:hypothetical protein D0Z00_000382 [Geotrichum galactomycetum]|uniref:Uncharacterized protein n=1 Tax=Geotrichum galactomycetum TaxID=27317 RepID=A0ACB6V9Z1_9ASCO|nr:hypothetical protein D0Z00_000382 [Geotrichum candidum]